MDGCTGGRRDVGASGSRGNWQAWLRFCFLLTAHSHITSSDAGRGNLSCVFPSPSYPLPPLAFESFSSWVQFCSCRVRVSVCMVMSTSVSVCMCVIVVRTHTHMQQPQDLDQFPVEKRGVSLRQDIWKWAFCSRHPLHSDLIILSGWDVCLCGCMCVSLVCVHMETYKLWIHIHTYSYYMIND